MLIVELNYKQALFLIEILKQKYPKEPIPDDVKDILESLDHVFDIDIT